MWRLYVVSSASTRISPGSARLIARTKSSRSTEPSAGNVSWSGSYQCSQNGSAPADEVLPGPALRLVDAERRRAVERRAEERVGDPVCVQPVARLVERRPDRLEVVGLVPRREADVPVREGGAERVRRRVEPPGPALEAERRDDALRERALLRPAGRPRGGTRRRPRAPTRRSRSAPAAAPRTPRAPRSSASRARSRPGAACTGCPTTRSTRCSGASARRSSGGREGTTRSRCSRRASTHAWCPRAPSRVISSRSAVGTRRAFSQSRRVTRTRLRSSESYGSDSTSGSAARGVGRPRRRRIARARSGRASRAGRRARPCRAAASSRAAPSRAHRPPAAGRPPRPAVRAARREGRSRVRP